MSHNAYYDNPVSETTSLSNYLIFIENHYNEENHSTVIPCTSITEAIEVAKSTKKICSLYKRNGTLGKNWEHYCDISKGVY